MSAIRVSSVACRSSLFLKGDDQMGNSDLVGIPWDQVVVVVWRVTISISGVERHSGR